MQSNLDSLKLELLNAFNRRAAYGLDWLSKNIEASCGSPIEVSVIRGLFLRYKTDKLLSHGQSCICFSPIISTEENLENYAKYDWYDFISVQPLIGKYRPDFCFQRIVNNKAVGQLIVIECDGHEFHERTKEQAAHDRKKDRWFQLQGYMMLRFTGSEIYGNLKSVVDQIHEFIPKIDGISRNG